MVFHRREYCKTPGKPILIEINILPHADFCNPKPFPFPLPSLENGQAVALFYNKSKYTLTGILKLNFDYK